MPNQWRCDVLLDGNRLIDPMIFKDVVALQLNRRYLEMDLTFWLGPIDQGCPKLATYSIRQLAQ